jgi:hypothetical protein
MNESIAPSASALVVQVSPSPYTYSFDFFLARNSRRVSFDACGQRPSMRVLIVGRSSRDYALLGLDTAGESYEKKSALMPIPTKPRFPLKPVATSFFKAEARR